MNLILIALVVLGLLAFAYVARGARRLEAQRNARVAGERQPVAAGAARPAPASVPAPALASASVTTEPSAAAADGAASPFLAAPDGPADDLMAIKGIGPKLATRLGELGVFHYRQIAAWTPAQLAEVDAQLGSFQGRPARDQWQSQAALLAAGDIKGYERAHGKLGPGSGGPA